MKSNEKADFTNFFKPCLWVALVLIVVCSVIVGIFGFNKGFDFVGGTQIVVDFSPLENFDTEDDKQMLDAQKVIKKIIADNDATINSIQEQGTTNEKDLVITIYKTDEENLKSIRLAINKEFNTTDYYKGLVNKDEILGKDNDLTRTTSEIDGFVSPKILLTVVATLLFALAVVTVYALFRVKARGAMTIAFGGIFDIVLTLCFVGITRLQINRYIFVCLALVLCLSVYASVNLMLKIKENASDPHNLKFTNKEIANMSVGENIKQMLWTYVGAFVLAIIWCVFGTQNILFALLSCMIGIAIVLASHIFVLPAFWVAISSKKETFTKQGVARVETVMVEKKDKEAEVVEVEDTEETTKGEEKNRE